MGSHVEVRLFLLTSALHVPLFSISCVRRSVSAVAATSGNSALAPDGRLSSSCSGSVSAVTRTRGSRRPTCGEHGARAAREEPRGGSEALDNDEAAKEVAAKEVATKIAATKLASRPQ